MRCILQMALFTILIVVGATTVQGRDSIRLGTEDWPPYSFQDVESKVVTGLSTEVVSAVLGKMGVTIEDNQIYPWARVQQFVYQGKVDGAYTASINEERKRFCYFPAESIVETTWVLFINKKDSGRLQFETLDDLKGRRIGLIRGYNYPKAFKEYIVKYSRIEEVSLETQNINKLLHGRYEYMPAIRETTVYLAKNSPLLQKQNASSRLYSFPKIIKMKKFYLMFSKKTVSQEFVEEFSNALGKFKKSADYHALLKKYLYL